MPEDPIEFEIDHCSQQSYLASLRKSALLPDDRISEILAAWQRLADSQQAHGSALAAHFGKQAAITPWQNEMLLARRYKGFFVADYILTKRLGGGAMSNVYLATAADGSQVAIKVLNHFAKDSSAEQRFYFESRATRAMQHPNIVRAIDSGEFEGNLYLAMEYVVGRNLSEMVKTEGPLDFLRAADYIAQAADGLAYAHEIGVVHRDVKPSNLLVDERDSSRPFGTVKLSDLGLARSPYEDHSQSIDNNDKLMGTPNYMAPEQMLDCHQVDGRADIYSLGCTFYQLLTGHAPFHDGAVTKRLLKHLSEAPRSIAFDRPGTPETLVAVCRKMLAKRPDGRFSTAADVSRRLIEWMARQAGPGGGRETRSSASGKRTDRPDDFSDLARRHKLE